jgi:hypothetical protein
MSRAETIALVDDVLRLCGVGNVAEFAEVVNHEDGARHFIDMCRAAAAQPPSRASAAHVEPTAAGAEVEPMVEVAVAEALVAEAFKIGDERVAQEAARHAAEELAAHEAAARQANQRATRHAATSTVSWQSLKTDTTMQLQAAAREDVLAAYMPRFETAVAAVEAKAEHAASMLADAREIKRGVRAGFERQARTAAATVADRKAAAEDRAAAEKDRTEHVALIALLRSRLKEEKRVGSWS